MCRNVSCQREVSEGRGKPDQLKRKSGNLVQTELSWPLGAAEASCEQNINSISQLVSKQMLFYNYNFLEKKIPILLSHYPKKFTHEYRRDKGVKTYPNLI